MNDFENRELIRKHAYYIYIFINEVELRNEFKSWSRERLISWLKWNDRNGIYDDEQSLDEIGCIITYEERLEIMVNQIIQKDGRVYKS